MTLLQAITFATALALSDPELVQQIGDYSTSILVIRTEYICGLFIYIFSNLTTVDVCHPTSVMYSFKSCQCLVGSKNRVHIEAISSIALMYINFQQFIAHLQQEAAYKQQFSFDEKALSLAVSLLYLIYRD